MLIHMVSLCPGWFLSLLSGPSAGIASSLMGSFASSPLDAQFTHIHLPRFPDTDLASSTTGPGHGRTAKVSEHRASLYISSRTSPSDVNTLHDFLSGPISRRDREFKETDIPQIEPSGTMDLMHRRRTKTQAAGHGFFLAMDFSPSWISHLWLTLTMDPLSQRYGVRMSQAQG